MNTTLSLRALALLGLAGIPFVSGCDSAGTDTDEGEVITRVTYTLTPAGGTAVTATFNDANRNGIVDAGEVTGATLAVGTAYAAAISVFGPSGEITGEVVAEKDEHAFVFTPGGAAAARLAVTSADTDANSLPFRRTGTVSVTGVEDGVATLRLELVHFGSEDAKKSAQGVPTAAMERDVDVTFPITISSGR